MVVGSNPTPASMCPEMAGFPSIDTGFSSMFDVPVTVGSKLSTTATDGRTDLAYLINLVLLRLHFFTDVGNRITELNKVVSRLHSEMKQIHQALMHGNFGVSDSATSEGSSMLGKYIMGAKNNFRDFSSAGPPKNTPLQVTVHEMEDEEGKKEEVVGVEATTVEVEDQTYAKGGEDQAASPTGSKRSWDTGFGSQEGESSIEGGAETSTTTPSENGADLN